MKLTEKQITKAVDWWKQTLSNPKFDNLGDGPRDQGNEMASLLATMSNQRNPMTEEVLEKFGAALADRIRQEASDNGQGIHIGVDYDPDAILSDAALAVEGFPDGHTMFPWKTNMWLRPDGSVLVSYGYRAKPQTL